jgi:hypothetical protein
MHGLSRARPLATLAVEDASWLCDLLDRLTADNESAFAVRWSVADAPADYIEKSMKAIVGIEGPAMTATFQENGFRRRLGAYVVDPVSSGSPAPSQSSMPPA